MNSSIQSINKSFNTLQNISNIPDNQLSQLQCKKHLGENLSNICVKCNIPLCPECISIHDQLHFSNNSCSEIKTIKSQVRFYTDIIKNNLSIINSELEQYEKMYREEMESNIVIDQNEKLLEMKLKLHQMVDDLFEQIQNKRQVNEQNNLVLAQVQKYFNNLEMYLINLESQNQLDCIKLMNTLDFETELLEQRKNIQMLKACSKYDNIQLSFHYDHFKQIDELFQQLVTLGPSIRKQYSQNQFKKTFTKQLDDIISPKVNQQVKTIFTNSQKNEFEINQNNYFDQCKSFLWVFKKNLLRIIDPLNKEKIEYKLKFDIPEFSQTIATPNGDIYVVGGQNYQKQLMDQTLKFCIQQKQLDHFANMIDARKSMGLIYLNGNLYSIGGITRDLEYTEKCEVLSIKNKQWKSISNLTINVCNPTLTTFKQKYIMKFGGFNEYGYSNQIEKYDVLLNEWQVIDAVFDQSLPFKLKLENFHIQYNSCAIQINPNSILVFGGNNQHNKNSNISYILEEFQDYYKIKLINYKPLPCEFSFQQIPIILNKTVYCINLEQDFLVQFNGKDWKISVI